MNGAPSVGCAKYENTRGACGNYRPSGSLDQHTSHDIAPLAGFLLSHSAGHEIGFSAVVENIGTASSRVNRGVPHTRPRSRSRLNPADRRGSGRAEACAASLQGDLLPRRQRSDEVFCFAGARPASAH